MKMKRIKEVVASVPRYDCDMETPEVFAYEGDGPPPSFAVMELATGGEYIKVKDLLDALDAAVAKKLDAKIDSFIEHAVKKSGDVCRVCGNPPGPVCDSFKCNMRANDDGIYEDSDDWDGDE